MKRGTSRHPKLLRLGTILTISRPEAIGHLQLLWEFASEFCRDGGVGRNYSDAELSAAVDWEGDPEMFVNALIESKWLDRSETHRIGIHDWDQHCEESVKKYMRENRLRFWNGAKPFTSNKVGVARSSEKYRKVSPVFAFNHSHSHSHSHSQEPLPLPKPGTKRRCVTLADGNFDAFWKSYPRKDVGPTKAREAFDKHPQLCSDPLFFESVMRVLERFKSSDDWLKQGGQFVPMATTWLNQKRWEGEVRDGEKTKSGVSDKTKKNVGNIARGLGLEDAS